MPDLGELPSSLRPRTRWLRLGADVPGLVVHPAWDAENPSGAIENAVPVVFWMHGRTVDKELDPGRYLRWMRAGIATCAIDLPAHGERADRSRQESRSALEIVEQVIGEIDDVVEDLVALGGFDHNRMGIGGMSLGGMAALTRLCLPHDFRAVSVEATTGDWTDPRQAGVYDAELLERLHPIDHLDGWREIPVQAIHSRGDEWVPFEAQVRFIEALTAKYDAAELVELVAFDETGALHEHIGFGRHHSVARQRQVEFWTRHLLGVV